MSTARTRLRGRVVRKQLLVGVLASASCLALATASGTAAQAAPGDSGANASGPYDATGIQGPGPGVGNGQAVGQPCDGCVGNADNQNPPGQLPGPQDSNVGYECEAGPNHGVGLGNPAHTTCATSSQAVVPPGTPAEPVVTPGGPGPVETGPIPPTSGQTSGQTGGATSGAASGMVPSTPGTNNALTPAAPGTGAALSPVAPSAASVTPGTGTAGLAPATGQPTALVPDMALTPSVLPAGNFLAAPGSLGSTGSLLGQVAGTAAPRGSLATTGFPIAGMMLLALGLVAIGGLTAIAPRQQSTRTG